MYANLYMLSSRWGWPVGDWVGKSKSLSVNNQSSTDSVRFELIILVVRMFAQSARTSDSQCN